MSRHLVFDTETTGLGKPDVADLNSQPKITEIGIVEVLVEDGVARIGEEKSWLINPGEKLHPDTIKINGITDADLVGKPSFLEILYELEQTFLGADGLVCQNLPFDRKMLVLELRRVNREYAFPYPPRQLCTVSAYRHLKGYNLNLPTLYKLIMGREFHQEHRALSDARATAEIVIKDGLLR